MTPSCILSFHTNPYTCGVARFNKSLAEAMGVPMRSIESFISDPMENSLLSVKFDELPSNVVQLLQKVIVNRSIRFHLFLHDFNESETEVFFCNAAEKLYTAKNEIQEKLTRIRPDAMAMFAPGAPVIEAPKNFDLTLITFGMAHKIRVEGYKKLGTLINDDSRSIQLEISTALHEGTTFSEDFFSVNTEISEVFKGNVTFLGFLADAEVSRRLTRASALVAFFPFGVRENNTTVLSAMAHGCAVITNLDAKSPTWMQHGYSIFDIDQLDGLPSEIELKAVGQRAVEAVRPYSFASLVKLLDF